MARKKKELKFDVDDNLSDQLNFIIQEVSKLPGLMLTEPSTVENKTQELSLLLSEIFDSGDMSAFHSGEAHLALDLAQGTLSDDVKEGRVDPDASSDLYSVAIERLTEARDAALKDEESSSDSSSGSSSESSGESSSESESEESESSESSEDNRHKSRKCDKKSNKNKNRH